MYPYIGMSDRFIKKAKIMKIVARKNQSMTEKMKH